MLMILDNLHKLLMVCSAMQRKWNIWNIRVTKDMDFPHSIKDIYLFGQFTFKYSDSYKNSRR